MAKHNIAKILKGLRGGATFAGMDVLTQVKVNKTIPNEDGVEVNGKVPARIPNPHFERITKTNVGNTVVIGANYETMVKKHLAQQRIEEQQLADKLMAEGQTNAAKAIEENMADPNDFVVGERKWGTYIEGTPLIEHKGEIYLNVIYLKAGESVYREGGKVIEEDEVLGLNKSKPTADSQGGVNKKVTFRTFKLDSIIELRLNKEKYSGSFYYDPDEA